LLPPSLREWLPENHLAWRVIDAVGELDLAARAPDADVPRFDLAPDAYPRLLDRACP
jgi:hypothetical protein